MSDSTRPPFTIAIVNSKGGVGKTTTAIALAHLIADQVGPTVLLDLDRQASAAAWAAEAEESGNPIAATIQTVPADTPPARLARMIQSAGQGHDWLIIDTAPGEVDRADAAIEAVVANGGVVVIPTGPGPLDLPRAVVTLDDIAGRAQAFVLLTRTRAGTVSAKQARTDLDEIGATVLASEVPLRESVGSAAVRGLDELLSLYEVVANELLERVGNQ